MAGDRLDGSTLRVAVVHNLLRGGAFRRLSSQLDGIDAEVQEFTLAGARAWSDDAIVVPLTQKAAASPRLLRPIPRHLDVERVVRAWHRCFDEVAAWRPDVVWVNPCHLLQTPVMPSGFTVPTFYYCDEPRRADYDPAAKASTNPATRPLYAAKRARERQLDRASVARVDALATNSGWTARQILSAYGRKAEVIGCGVPAGFVPDPAGPRLPSHLLSVGTLLPSKGHDLAIQAAAEAGLALPFVVVAPRTDDAESARLRGMATELGIELDIQVGITDDELRDLYRGALATLYLAQAEPFGLVSIEAQACGSPVVVSDEGGLPETIVEGVTGWAVPREPAPVAARLLELSDPSRRVAMSTVAAQRAASRTWSRSAARIEARLWAVVQEQRTRLAA